jgi:hypothetical protein
VRIRRAVRDWRDHRPVPTSPTGGYDPCGYQVGVGVFLVAQVLALDWYLFVGRALLAAPRP